MATNPPLLPLIVAFAIMAPILFFRMRRMRNGTKVNVRKLIAFSAILLGFSVFAIVSSFSIGVPQLYAVVYGAVFVAVAYGSYHYSNKVLEFWRTADGSIYAKGGGIVLAFYIAALVARIVISATIGGGQGFTGSIQTPQVEASPDAILAATIADGLLMAGVGLLVGRNARIVNRFRAITKGRETARQEEE